MSFDRLELPNVDISVKDFIKNKNAELESLEREQDEILKAKAVKEQQDRKTLTGRIFPFLISYFIFDNNLILT